MWESFYDRTSQSCSDFNTKLLNHNKKKHDLLSVEYINYIHKDVLSCLDPYLMKNHTYKSNQRKMPNVNRSRTSKSGVPNLIYCKVNVEASNSSKKIPQTASCKRCEAANELQTLSHKLCELIPKGAQRQTKHLDQKLLSGNQADSEKQLPVELQKLEEPISHCKTILKKTTKSGISVDLEGPKTAECTLKLRRKPCTTKSCTFKTVPFNGEVEAGSKLFLFGEKGSGTRSRSGDVQDFYSLRDYCLSNGTLFEDPEFPAVETSLFFSETPDRNYEWKRPHEICSDPRFFVEGFSRFDVQQGILGDCWLLAATANLTLHSRLFFQIVPDDQEFDDKYAGIFHFRFWQYGKWIDIVIDDRLPTYRGELVFLHSTEDNEFWSALLEKAYAKLHGSYEALKGGSTCEAMEDFTGGVSEMYEMDSAPPNLFQIILKAYERSSLMGCSIEPDPDVLEAHTPTGLIRGHAYSITRVKYVEIHTPNVSGKIPLLRLRNPWGNEDEWNGPWSDEAPEWRYISQEEKEELGLTFDKDGEFWMSYKDFMKNFSRIEICNLNPDSLSEAELQHDNKKKWEMSVFEGEWVRGVTAGGCRNFLTSFWHNPQYRITLTEVDEDDDENKCTLIVGLMQKNRRQLRKAGVDLLTIGFAIYHLSYPDRLPKPLDLNFFKYNASVARSPSFVNLREVSCRFKLPPGTYCIVPSTFDPNEEGEFLLRVFTEKQNVMEENDDEIGFGTADDNANKEPTDEEQQEFDKVYEFFLKLAGEDKEVDWMELKNILDYSLKSALKVDGFSKDVCRSMIAMLDSDKSGKLGFVEFKDLWTSIRQWKNVWMIYDKDTSGTFSGFELREALNAAGFRLNNKILNILMHRYGNKNGEMDFEDFMMCAIKLKTMIEHFSKKLRTGLSYASFSIDEWLESTLYS